MGKSFIGKVALVTGGSSGIGRATAIAFAKEGAKVVIGDILTEKGEETVRLIRQGGGDAIFVQVDVSKSTDVKNLIQSCIQTYGKLDCAFNNAGIEGGIAPTADCTEENWDRVIDINLKGQWLCMKYEIPQMLKQGKGAIVNMASVAGLVAVQGLPAYCASKGGIIQLTKAAALEYAKAGIRINVVCPGLIETPLAERVINFIPEYGAQVIAGHPLGRMGFPREVADAVVWLCSDAASFITGHALAIDGGYVSQ